MSMEALNAVCQTFPAMRAALAGMDASERPSYEASVAVSLHLANKHRSQRGYANESVQQIAADLGITERKVRRVLKVLDELGFWIADGKGNQHAPTRRVAAFLDPAASSGNRTKQNDGASSASRTQRESEHRPVATEHRPVPVQASSGNRTMPPSPIYNPQGNREGVRGNNKSTDIVPAPNAEPVIIEAPAHLVKLARAIFATEAPDVPYVERPAVALDAANRWMELLAATPNPNALTDAPVILRWALHHRYWSARISTVREIADNWTKVARDYAAQDKSGPPVSPALAQSLDSIAQAIGAA